MTSNESYNDDIRKAVDVMRRGGTILDPTDTVWGIGCDASNTDAVNKIFKIKRRADSKALICLVDSVAALERTVEEVPEVAYQLIDAAVDPITIVYDKGTGVSPSLLAEDGSIGVRVTGEEFSKRLCAALRKPLVSTSANISGEPSPKSFDEISPEILEAVDYVCQSKRNDPWATKASTVIKISSGGLFTILRK